MLDYFWRTEQSLVWTFVSIRLRHWSLAPLPFSLFSSLLLCTGFKGQLLVCHSEICRGSFLDGHLLEKVTVPPNSSSRSHFQHACGCRVTIWSLLSVCLSVSRVRRDPWHTPLCNRYCLSTVFRSRYRYWYMLLYNQWITQWNYVKQQASSNFSSLFAFKLNPSPFLSSSFP